MAKGFPVGVGMDDITIKNLKVDRKDSFARRLAVQTVIVDFEVHVRSELQRDQVIQTINSAGFIESLGPSMNVKWEDSGSYEIRGVKVSTPPSNETTEMKEEDLAQIEVIKGRIEVMEKEYKNQ